MVFGLVARGEMVRDTVLSMLRREVHRAQPLSACSVVWEGVPVRLTASAILVIQGVLACSGVHAVPTPTVLLSIATSKTACSFDKGGRLLHHFSWRIHLDLAKCGEFTEDGMLNFRFVLQRFGR